MSQERKKKSYILSTEFWEKWQKVDQVQEKGGFCSKEFEVHKAWFHDLWSCATRTCWKFKQTCCWVWKCIALAWFVMIDLRNSEICLSKLAKKKDFQAWNLKKSKSSFLKVLFLKLSQIAGRKLMSQDRRRYYFTSSK